MLKQFTQVESLASAQSRQKQQLASNIGYQTAPHERVAATGYNAPQPSYNAPQPSYNPPQPSYNPPPPQAGNTCICVLVYNVKLSPPPPLSLPLSLPLSHSCPQDSTAPTVSTASTPSLIWPSLCSYIRLYSC